MKPEQAKSILVSFNRFASGWKRMISLFGLFATVIILALIGDDMKDLAEVIKAIGYAFGGFGVFASVAKIADKE
jgi:hypothetical protein